MAHDPDRFPCCGCGILTAQDDPAWGTVTLCATCDPDATAERCIACAEPADYCLGHGPIGDAYGWSILTAHDDGDHERCHPAACFEAPWRAAGAPLANAHGPACCPSATVGRGHDGAPWACS